MKMTENDVRRQIIDAFKDTVYPGDDHLVVFDPKVDPDCGYLYDLLQGKSWSDLLNELDNAEGPDLYRYSSFYSFSTPQSFYYYLPAFLITAMDLERSDTVGSYLIYYFNNLVLGRNELEHYRDLLFGLINPEQHQAIKSFFDYLIIECPDKALNAAVIFWNGI